MYSITRHIEYLISRHDCVVVPGWGAFIAQYQPARIDAASGLIVPPSRAISFNQSVMHNDGLLTSSIVRREKVSHEAALDAIKREVSMLRLQLDTNGEVAMGRLGMFSKDNSNMLFTPSCDSIVSAQFMGLPSVSTRKAAEETVVEEKPRRHDVIYVPVSRNIFKVAASLILLIGLGITLSTPVLVDDTNTDFASISAPKVTAPVKVSPIVAEPAHDAELFIAIPDASIATATVDTTTVVTEQLAINSIRCNDTDSYCLIVASLASRELAEEYIAERGDASMHILECNGKYRIYVATGATASQAMAPTRDTSFASRYPAAWVCRR